MPSMNLRQWLGLTVVVCSLSAVCGAHAHDGAEKVQAASTWSAPPTAPEASSEPWPVSDGPSSPMPRAVYVEVLGAGLIYSVNYERYLGEHVASRIGGSFLPTGRGVFFGMPVTLSYVGLRWFELGAGASLLCIADSDTSHTWSPVQLVGTAFAGLRFHPVDNPGFQFRVGAMVIVGDGDAFGDDADGSTPPIAVFPWPYLSVGGGY